MKYKCLTIAGFDGSGGAGIQADLKTFSALGCYGMTVLTALPVQNTCGVKRCYDIPSQCIYEQLITIFEDITPDAIKIGMLSNSETIAIVADVLSSLAKNIPLVLDPVMYAKNGASLLKADAIYALKNRLIPLASIVTPNLPEAKQLIPNLNDKCAMAAAILNLGCKTVLLKGGHESSANCDDLFLSKKEMRVLSTERIMTKNTHGTGCTLSSAIASNLAKGLSTIDACYAAKEYLTQAIRAVSVQSVGKGRGPVHHFHHWY